MITCPFTTSSLQPSTASAPRSSAPPRTTIKMQLTALLTPLLTAIAIAAPTASVNIDTRQTGSLRVQLSNDAVDTAVQRVIPANGCSVRMPYTPRSQFPSIILAKAMKRSSIPRQRYADESTSLARLPPYLLQTYCPSCRIC
ncbi:hypothetical protein IG631_12935 [Alternaria alternata]|nr:hypothetical protein IG631_12935 [Alternaria alternata]